MLAATAFHLLLCTGRRSLRACRFMHHSFLGMTPEAMVTKWTGLQYLSPKYCSVNDTVEIPGMGENTLKCIVKKVSSQSMVFETKMYWCNKSACSLHNSLSTLFKHGMGLYTPHMTKLYYASRKDSCSEVMNTGLLSFHVERTWALTVSSFYHQSIISC
jgi:hypothetical protein